MMKILTGGAGYLGSHTCSTIREGLKGSYDSFLNSKPKVERIENILPIKKGNNQKKE